MQRHRHRNGTRTKGIAEAAGPEGREGACGGPLCGCSRDRDSDGRCDGGGSGVGLDAVLPRVELAEERDERGRGAGEREADRAVLGDALRELERGVGARKDEAAVVLEVRARDEAEREARGGRGRGRGRQRLDEDDLLREHAEGRARRLAEAEHEDRRVRAAAQRHRAVKELHAERRDARAQVQRARAQVVAHAPPQLPRQHAERVRAPVRALLLRHQVPLLRRHRRPHSQSHSLGQKVIGGRDDEKKKNLSARRQKGKMVNVQTLLRTVLKSERNEPKQRCTPEARERR